MKTNKKRHPEKTEIYSFPKHQDHLFFPLKQATKLTTSPTGLFRGFSKIRKQIINNKHHFFSGLNPFFVTLNITKLTYNDIYIPPIIIDYFISFISQTEVFM